jgi:hypothetical protein
MKLKRSKAAVKKELWLPFQHVPRSAVSLSPATLEAIAAMAEMTPEAVLLQAEEDSRYSEYWQNNLYFVEIVRDPQETFVCLSVRRQDREAVHDWRHMQRIKNELFGPEVEAVELYPAESRLVDTANQYHLWALKQPRIRFPFGFRERSVSDVPSVGAAKQRPRSNR